MTAPIATTNAAAAAPARTPVWRLSVNGTDVSREISPMVLSVEYTDHAHGQSDEITVKIENRDQRWSNAWYPSKGDTVELLIGYVGEQLLPCGRFEIDKLTTEGPPDTFTIKCLAAGIIPALRTKKSVAYQGQRLVDIVNKVADAHGFSVVGAIDDTRVGRVTQYRETDLSFLLRLSERFGYVFSVRGTQLVFYKLGSLESADVVWTIARGPAIKRYKFDDETRTLYRACTISYLDGLSGKVLTQTVTDPSVTKGDVWRISSRVESDADALQQATNALHFVNSANAKATLTLIGNPRVMGGATVQSTGFGQPDGKYLIQTARHKIARSSGYETELEMTRVA